MPIYEYVCPGCQLEEEVLVRGTAAGDGRLCATCGRPMERKVSLPGTVIFTGSGYYTTDYKRKEGGSSAAKPSSDRSSDGASEKSVEKKDDKASGAASPAPAKDSATPSSAPPSGSSAPAASPVPAAGGDKKRA